MIAITPLITPLAGKIGGGRAVALGFGLATVGFAALAFVKASWTYAAFVVPLLVLSVGLGLANGPASSGSTAAVRADQVGAAAGISNMARYVGAAVAVAVIAMVNNTVATNRPEDGATGRRRARRGAGRLRADDGGLVRRRRRCSIRLMRRHRPTGTPADRARGRRGGQRAHDPGSP